MKKNKEADGLQSTKEKVRPRSKNNANMKRDLLKIYNKEMEETSEKFKQKNPAASDTDFYLFQSVESKTKVIDDIFNIAYFYDANFTGNKDFMHIPNLKQITENYVKFPMIMAKKKDFFGKEEIVGITTIKSENNKNYFDNPFFPTKNETILSITGVLTKKDVFDSLGNKVSGIGRALIKSAIKGAYEYNKEKRVRLVCEIDCRNYYSLNAVTKVTDELKSEGYNINTFMTGYYEILNKNNELLEAPTFIVEIDLNGDKKVEEVYKNFSYTHCDSAKLYFDLTDVIKDNTKETKRFITAKDNNIIVYHEVLPILTKEIGLEVGNAALGNDRVPVNKQEELNLVRV